MLTEYIDAAMRHADFERLDDGTVYAHIPGLPGVYANAEGEAATRAELRSVLEGWIILGLRLGHQLPAVDGIELTPALQPV